MPIETIRGEPFNIRHRRPGRRARADAVELARHQSLDVGSADPGMVKGSFRVVRYDSRGHGQSTAPDRPYSIAELGDDALAILDHLGIEQGALVRPLQGRHGRAMARDPCRQAPRPRRAGQYRRPMGPPDLWNARIKTVRSQRHGGLDPADTGALVQPGVSRARCATMAKVSEMLETTPPLGYAGCCAAIRDMDQREPIRGDHQPGAGHRRRARPRDSTRHRATDRRRDPGRAAGRA
jgi:3-oxoadipate enol-lactonase